MNDNVGNGEVVQQSAPSAGRDEWGEAGRRAQEENRFRRSPNNRCVRVWEGGCL